MMSQAYPRCMCAEDEYVHRGALTPVKITMSSPLESPAFHKPDSSPPSVGLAPPADRAAIHGKENRQTETLLK